jgi:hypothetical protein
LEVIKFISIICLCLIFFTAFAQEGETQKEPPCSSPEASQFDFWVGDWDLTWGENGHGTNSIKKIMDGCVIQENFDGAPSIRLKGMSVSTFGKQLGKWQQTWVDNSGGYLDFIGEYTDGKMILSREFVKDSKEFMQRMVWYNISENEFDWNWERSEDKGQTWEVLWNIHYKRKNK